MNTSGIVCPITKQPLEQVAADRVATADGQISYPVKDDLPILLAPEAITSQTPWPRDVKVPQYDEAYTEMAFYNAAAAADVQQIRGSSLLESDSAGIRRLGALAQLSAEERGDFPEPALRWLASTVDVASESACYRHIGPVKDKRVIQIGGKGLTALLLLQAGASEAMLLTPMHGEALVAIELASALGLKDRLRCVIGVAEEIPIADSYVDVCFSGGCVHHMRTEVAFAEMARILTPGGKFAAVEPWKAPGHVLGTKIFGKRERGVFCKPLTSERVTPFFSAFSKAECARNGTFTRYPAIVAEKAGMRFSVPVAKFMADVDAKVCNCLPFARHFGSGVALLGTK